MPVSDRRTFLSAALAGLGSLTLDRAHAGLLFPTPSPSPHFPKNIRRVVHLCMAGGPSQLETFDPKPALNRLDGRAFPESFGAGKNLIARGSFAAFRRHGESGMAISELFPHTATIADDICLIRSMVTDGSNHHHALSLLKTCFGATFPGSHAVMLSNGKFPDQPVSSKHWPQGALLSPTAFSGNVSEPGIRASVSPYLSLRTNPMRAARESRHVLEKYGVMEPGDGSFASNCLAARQLLESGTSFVQLYHRGWDHHSDLENKMRHSAALTDKSAAALVSDLKERGLLEDTLVIWAGEFGRTPYAQGSGRDHHARAFSIWMAGAGVSGGHVHGSTDDLGYAVVENPVHVTDLRHAVRSAVYPQPRKIPA